MYISDNKEKQEKKLIRVLFVSVFVVIPCGEIVDFGKSNKMMKMSGKVKKSNTYNWFCSNISFFI